MQLRRLFSKTAFTLIELLVSMLLVSFIVLGIVVITIVLSNSGQDYGQRYLVRSATQTTLNNILNNASLAVGSAIPNDEAILLGGTHGLTDPDTFCIHQPGTSTQGGSNLVDSASDIWLCYSWTNNYQINWCAEKYTAGSDPRGASSCSSAAAANLIANPATGQNITFLGTAYTAPSVTFANSGGQSLFSVTNLVNCLNNILGCSSSNPETNPQVTLSGSVIPLQASGD
jgi:type II secretory pathway pseudopilin PulG